MKAIVLCGGKSTRMGKDKAFLKWRNDYWFERIYKLLNSINQEVFISHNEKQQLDLTPLFPSQKLILDKVNYPGPLNGILSSFSELQDDLLVLACDLQKIRLKSIQTLLDNYEVGGYDVYLFQGEYLEPLLRDLY